MERNVDLLEISDGKRYKASDLVKVYCNECKGCSECCRGMGDSIKLDPFDIHMLCKATGKSFSELMNGLIELNVADGVIIPNIKMQDENDACSFLDINGRCSVHELRPGFCRLFPLGRVYEDDGFDYFLQINECHYSEKSKIKIKKWLGIAELSAYEKYVTDYHSIYKSLGDKLIKAQDENLSQKLNVTFLNSFFVLPYDIERDFYEQYYDRSVEFRKEYL